MEVAADGVARTCRSRADLDGGSAVLILQVIHNPGPADLVQGRPCREVIYLEVAVDGSGPDDRERPASVHLHVAADTGVTKTELAAVLLHIPCDAAARKATCLSSRDRDVAVERPVVDTIAGRAGRGSGHRDEARARYLEHRAVVRRAAACRRSVKIAGAVGDQPGVG